MVLLAVVVVSGFFFCVFYYAVDCKQQGALDAGRVPGQIAAASAI